MGTTLRKYLYCLSLKLTCRIELKWLAIGLCLIPLLVSFFSWFDFSIGLFREHFLINHFNTNPHLKFCFYGISPKASGLLWTLAIPFPGSRRSVGHTPEWNEYYPWGKIWEGLSFLYRILLRSLFQDLAAHFSTSWDPWKLASFSVNCH